MYLNQVTNLQAGAVSKTASGAWQIIKIGGGLILITAGVSVAACPCAVACGCGTMSCLDQCDGNKDDAKEAGKCAICCATTGFIAGAPLAITGGILVKSGVKGLRKILGYKKKPKHDHVTIGA
jgi:hypothetical protein